MRKIIEHPGNVYNGWTAVEFSHKEEKTGATFWVYRCICGEERPVNASKVHGSQSMNCGCGRKQTLSGIFSTHKMCDHPMYATWYGMKTRCTNPNQKHWDIYGGRGIRYCERWESFESFLEDMQSSWAPGLTLERVDGDGNYEPGNCKWATQKEQANNRKSNVKIICPDGEARTITMAAEKYGIAAGTLAARIRRGVPESRWFAGVYNTAPLSNQPTGE